MIAVPTICLVEWEDATMGGWWQDGTHPAKPEPALVYSVGWLVHDDPERVTIVQTLSDGQHGNSLVIPRGMIRKIQKAQLK